MVGQQQRRTGCGPDSRTSLLLSCVTRGTPSPSNIHTLTPYMLVPAQGGCSWAGQVVPGKGFVGNVQNLRVWEYVLTPPEVGHGMVWPFERSHVRRGTSNALLALSPPPPPLAHALFFPLWVFITFGGCTGWVDLLLAL